MTTAALQFQIRLNESTSRVLHRLLAQIRCMSMRPGSLIRLNPKLLT